MVQSVMVQWYSQHYGYYSARQLLVWKSSYVPKINMF